MIESGSIVLPGDIISDLSSNKGIVLLGPGLQRHTDEACIVTRSGKLCHKAPNVYWIESYQKRYIPKKGDLVLGVVLARRGDVLKVDINADECASLPTLAFEGATKKQKPDVVVGDLIYAKLLSAYREMEPELICVDRYFKAGRLGLLPKNGFTFDVSLGTAYKLLEYKSSTLRQLGAKFPYEIAVGMNGKVWINAKSVNNIQKVVNKILSIENS